MQVAPSPANSKRKKKKTKQQSNIVGIARTICGRTFIAWNLTCDVYG